MPDPVQRLDDVLQVVTLPVSLVIVLERQVSRPGPRDGAGGQGGDGHPDVDEVLDLLRQKGVVDEGVERLPAGASAGDGHAGRRPIPGGLDAPLLLGVVGHVPAAVAQEPGTFHQVGVGAGGVVGEDGGQDLLGLAAIVPVLLSEDEAEEGRGDVGVVEGRVPPGDLLAKIGRQPRLLPIGRQSLGELAGGAGLRVGLTAALVALHPQRLHSGKVVGGAGRGPGLLGVAGLGLHGGNDGGRILRRWGWRHRRRRRRGGRAAQHDHGLGGQILHGRLNLGVNSGLLGLHSQVGGAEHQKDDEEELVQEGQGLPEVDNFAAAASG